MNLHDYIGANREWQQLWADDQIAIWFERTDSDVWKYEVFTASDQLLTKDCVKITSKMLVQDLSEAMRVWNALIEKHISLQRA